MRRRRRRNGAHQATPVSHMSPDDPITGWEWNFPRDCQQNADKKDCSLHVNILVVSGCREHCVLVEEDINQNKHQLATGREKKTLNKWGTKWRVSRANSPTSGKSSSRATQKRPWGWTKREGEGKEGMKHQALNLKDEGKGGEKGAHKVVSLAWLVHFRKGHQKWVRHVLLENSQNNHGKEGEDDVPEGVGNSIPWKLTRETIDEWKIEWHQVQCQRLVERVQDDLGQAAVGKMTVNQEKPLQKPVCWTSNKHHPS